MVCDRCVDGVRKALRPAGRRRAGERVRDSDLGLPDLWDLVAESGILRFRGTGGRDGDGAPLPLDSAAAWRDRVRTNLVGWCHVLAEDSGSSLADAVDTVPWMCQKVAFNADRLLAHPEHADQLAADLLGWTDDDVPDGRPAVPHEGLAVEGRRLAFRSRGATLTIACSCGGRVPIDHEPGAILRCRDCGERGGLAHWKARLAPNLDQPMTAPDRVAWLALEHRLAVSEQTLRQWASRGKIARHPKDDAGRTTYTPSRSRRSRSSSARSAHRGDGRPDCCGRTDPERRPARRVVDSAGRRYSRRLPCLAAVAVTSYPERGTSNRDPSEITRSAGLSPVHDRP